MIYKCKNCGQEYSQKIDYCDCGNNTFVIIKTADDDVKNNSYEDSFRSFEDNSVQYADKFHDEYDVKAETEEEYDDNEDEKKVNFAQVIAIAMFVIAILSSSLIIYKACKKITEKKDKPHAVKLVKNPSVPEIDTYWDNTSISLPKAQNKTTLPKTEVNNQQKTTALTQTPVKTETAPQKTAAQKTQQPATSPKVNDNNAEKIRKQAEQVRKAEEQRKAEDLKKQKAAEEVKKAEEKRIAEEKKKEQERQYQKEFLQYKTDLRSALFKWFPVLNVQGSGSATVSFSVSADGKLLNRRFICQSDNQSLNDAMYNMLMQTPYFKSPPTGYKGEDFVLKMDFYNGSYSFSYVK